MKDWTDEAWNRFARESECYKLDPDVVYMMKEAWLDGARAGVAKTKEVLSESLSR